MITVYYARSNSTNSAVYFGTEIELGISVVIKQYAINSYLGEIEPFRALTKLAKEQTGN